MCLQGPPEKLKLALKNKKTKHELTCVAFLFLFLHNFSSSRMARPKWLLSLGHNPRNHCGSNRPRFARHRPKGTSHPQVGGPPATLPSTSVEVCRNSCIGHLEVRTQSQHSMPQFEPQMEWIEGAITIHLWITSKHGRKLEGWAPKPNEGGNNYFRDFCIVVDIVVH